MMATVVVVVVILGYFGRKTHSDGSQTNGLAYVVKEKVWETQQKVWEKFFKPLKTTVHNICPMAELPFPQPLLYIYFFKTFKPCLSP